MFLCGTNFFHVELCFGVTVLIQEDKQPACTRSILTLGHGSCLAFYRGIPAPWIVKRENYLHMCLTHALSAVFGHVTSK